MTLDPSRANRPYSAVRDPDSSPRRPAHNARPPVATAPGADFPTGRSMNPPAPPEADGPDADRTLVRNTRWWAHPRSLWQYVTSLHDTPHAIALGASVGVFIGMTPTVGFQMILAGLIWYVCRPLLHFNCKIAIISVYVSNPITTLPIFWFNYCVGRMFLGGGMTFAEFRDVLLGQGGGPGVAWWRPVVTLFVEIGWPLLLGSVIVAGVCALLTYPAVRWALESFVRRRKRKLAAEPPVDVDAHVATTPDLCDKPSLPVSQPQR